MAEQFRSEENTRFNGNGPINPDRVEHFSFDTDLAQQAHETAAAIRSVYESRAQAASWVGSTPRSEFTNLWTEQATRELMGLPPTVEPARHHFESMIEAAPNGGTVVDFGTHTPKPHGEVHDA